MHYNQKGGGSGICTICPNLQHTKVVANSSIQEVLHGNNIANVGIGGPTDPSYFKLRITGNVYVDDTDSGTGIVLASQLEIVRSSHAR